MNNKLLKLFKKTKKYKDLSNFCSCSSCVEVAYYKWIEIKLLNILNKKLNEKKKA